MLQGEGGVILRHYHIFTNPSGGMTDQCRGIFSPVRRSPWMVDFSLFPRIQCNFKFRGGVIWAFSLARDLSVHVAIWPIVLSVSLLSWAPSFAIIFPRWNLNAHDETKLFPPVLNSPRNPCFYAFTRPSQPSTYDPLTLLINTLRIYFRLPELAPRTEAASTQDLST